MSSCVQAELACFEASCRERFAITEVLYNCPEMRRVAGSAYSGPRPSAAELRDLFRQRRLSNAPLDTSGVWRYRELFPFLNDNAHVVTLREGNTPLLDAPIAAQYGGLDRSLSSIRDSILRDRSKTTA